MQKVSKIACNNNAGFDMKFRVKYEEGTSDTHHTSWTSTYPINQTKTIDLRDYALKPGTEACPEVSAVMGEEKSGKNVIYDPDTENVATYRVHGTTLSYDVDLED